MACRKCTAPYNLARGPELTDNLRMISDAYSFVGLWDKYEEFSVYAFKIDKDSARLFATKSVIERINQNYQSALRFANKAYQLDSSNWDYVDQKAWLLSLVGRNRESLDTRLNWINNNNNNNNTPSSGFSSNWLFILGVRE